jgi:hypothetical protein
MMIPHYAYLLLKMPGTCGVISIRGDIKRAFDFARESCEIADRLMESAELQDLKEPSQDFQDIHPTEGLTQQDSPIVPGGAFQGFSRRQQSGPQIGTFTRQIPVGK